MKSHNIKKIVPSKENHNCSLVELLEFIQEAQKDIEERERKGIILEPNVVYLEDGTKIRL